MADIAFLLLIFFLVTTNIAEEQGVLVRLPPYEINQPVTPTSQVLTVIVDAKDRLMVEEEEAIPEDLPRYLREYILSPQRKPTQAVVSLVHDRSTSYNRYLEVYDAVLSGYRQLWDEQADRRYGTAYDRLTEDQQREVRKIIPMILSEAEPNDALGI
jgi:biopolymer transport protein ExbD